MKDKKQKPFLSNIVQIIWQYVRVTTPWQDIYFMW